MGVIAVLGMAVMSTWAAGGAPVVDSTPTASLDTAETWVQDTCALIYKGRMEEALGQLSQVDGGMTSNDQVVALEGILHDYQALSDARAQSRQEAYQKELDKITRMKQGKSAVAPDPNQSHDPNKPVDETFDPNDPNDLVVALSVLASAREYASPDQRKELFQDTFVQDVLQRSLSEATQDEAEGRWSDSYARCYWWLDEIDPNNVGYKDYTEELLDKIRIASSFEDSPCETSVERYKGIRPEIFERAMQVLDTFYVSRIDYGQMAKDSLDQCRLLTEVLTALPQKTLAQSSLDLNTPPEPNALNAWNAVIKTLVQDVEQRTDGLTFQGFLKLFHRVLELNHTTVNIPEQILVAQFSQAAFASLDPHTYLVWPKEIEDFSQAMNNEFTGIGVEISKQQGVLTVGSLLLDTPAYRAGLDVDDVIEAVNGLPTKDLPLSCAVMKIKGPKGSTVNLTIRRDGVPKPFDVKITRDVINVPTLQGWQRLNTGQWRYIIDPNDKIGYVRLTSFGRDTDEEFEATLDELEKNGLKGLVMDLRTNPGGHLDTAVNIVDMFIKDGLIVSTRPGFGFQQQWEIAHSKGTHPDYPLVILVNSDSASASEIVSGALSDDHYKRAILVGQRTHGKGSVQMIRAEGLEGAQLKFTMAYYHLPSGQRVNSRAAMEKMGRHDWGVAPNIKVALRTDEARKLWQVERKNAVLIQADREANHKEEAKPTLAETLASDPQLAVGLMVVKAQLAQRGELATEAHSM